MNDNVYLRANDNYKYRCPNCRGYIASTAIYNGEKVYVCSSGMHYYSYSVLNELKRKGELVMTKISDVYQGSDFIKKEDLTELPKVMTIAGVKVAEIETEEGSARKIQISFNETDKVFICNKTNAQTIKENTGEEEIEKWIGSKVSLWFDKAVTFKDKRTGGIRVKQKE
jgi:uncharacterized pyridoxamine 5'-phosphate oxidase family protein